MLKLAILFVAVVISQPASAVPLYDSGPAYDTGSYCMSVTNQCGEFSPNTALVIYSPFTLTATSIVSGATYGNYFYDGSPAPYVATHWSIWSSDPRTSFASGPAYSGTATGSISSNFNFSTLVSFSVASITLAAGDYYIGLQDELSDRGVTTYAYSSYAYTTLGRNSLTSDNLGYFFDDGELMAASFTIEGRAEGAGAVPEPAAWALMVIGFGLVGGTMRSRVRQMPLVAA